jgi:hypothetical protein
MGRRPAGVPLLRRCALAGYWHHLDAEVLTHLSQAIPARQFYLAISIAERILRIAPPVNLRTAGSECGRSPWVAESQLPSRTEHRDA